jgi:hypothetical protein
MTVVGLEFHNRYITACTFDDAATLVAEVRQLVTSIDTVLEWLSALPGCRCSWLLMHTV